MRNALLIKDDVYFQLCAQINAIKFSYKTNKQCKCQFPIYFVITWLYMASRLLNTCL